jgi:hypothetical protein
MQFSVTHLEVFPFIGFELAEDEMFAGWGAGFQSCAGAFEAIESVFGGQRVGREGSAGDAGETSAGDQPSIDILFSRTSCQ